MFVILPVIIICRPMKKLCLAALLLCSALLPTACITEETTAAPQDIVVPGNPLPPFAVVMHDGTTVSPATLAGRVAVIAFFTTSCPDCRRELPKLDALYRSYGSDSVAFVCISREEGPADVAAFWQEQGLALPYSAQTDRAVYNLFARGGVPRIYIADREGTVRLVYGEQGATAEKLRADIDALCRGERIY